AGVIYPITDMYDVPLMVARGYATLSFLYSAAEYIDDLDVPTYIYHLGDFDPSGVNVGEKIEETLRELAPDAKIYFERIAVTPGQITEWNLPTRPTKASDTRSKGFGNISVDLDAINPNALRALVQETIEQHLPPDQFAVLKAAEQSEREVITAWWAGSHRDPRHRKLNLGGQHGRRTSEEARSQSRYQREGRRGNNSDRKARSYFRSEQVQVQAKAHDSRRRDFADAFARPQPRGGKRLRSLASERGGILVRRALLRERSNQGPEA